MDTKRLRQRVLDLAIHGKLVPQNPQDEPASELLKRIAEEKERLIKDGKIKKSKKKANEDIDEVPFEVPQGWVWCKLEDICDSCLGKMLDKNRHEGVYQKYLRNVNVRWYDFALDDLLEMPFKEDEEDRFSIIEGDLVLCEGGEPGRCAIWTGKPIKFQKALHRLRCLNTITTLYIQRVIHLYSCNGTLEKYYTGSTIKHLTGESLSVITIPLPPLAEQHRIVSEVEKYFSLIDILEESENDLQQSIQKAKSKILDLAIKGKLVEKTGEWEYTNLGSVFQHNTGKALNRSAEQSGKLLPYITTSNLYWGRFELDTVKSMYFKENEIEKCTVTKGDLLVCEGGDIGRSAIWDYDYDICIQNHIHRLRPIKDALPKFYYYVMMHYKRTDNIEGKGIGMLGLSSKQLDKLIIPFPPLAEQHRIVAKIEELFTQLDNIAEALK